MVQISWGQAYCLDNVFKMLLHVNGDYTVATTMSRGEAGASSRRNKIIAFKGQEVACDKALMNEYIRHFEPRYKAQLSEVQKASKKDEAALKRA